MFFFFSSRRRHTRCGRDWSSDVCSSDLSNPHRAEPGERAGEVQHPPPGRVPARPRDQRSGNGVGGEYEQTHGEKVPSTQTWHAGNLLTSSRDGGDVARPDLGTLRSEEHTSELQSRPHL